MRINKANVMETKPHTTKVYQDISFVCVHTTTNEVFKDDLIH